MKLLTSALVLLGTLLTSPQLRADDCSVFYPLEMRMTFRDPNAIVHINEYRTRKTGRYRVFATGPQNPCFEYPYEVSVQSAYGNKVILIKAKVGEIVLLDF